MPNSPKELTVRCLVHEPGSMPTSILDDGLEPAELFVTEIPGDADHVELCVADEITVTVSADDLARALSRMCGRALATAGLTGVPVRTADLGRVVALPTIHRPLAAA